MNIHYSFVAPYTAAAASNVISYEIFPAFSHGCQTDLECLAFISDFACSCASSVNTANTPTVSPS